MAFIQTNQNGIVDERLNAQLLDKTIDEMFERRNELGDTLVLGKLFYVENLSSGLSVKMTTVGSELDMPRVNDDVNPYPMTTPVPGYAKELVVVNQSQGIRVTKTALKGDRHGKILFTIGGQMKAAMRKDEYVRASFLNNGFTSGTGADAVYMYSATHPQEGGAVVGYWSNLGTGPLTGPNLHALRLKMYNMKDAKGHPMPIKATGAVFNQALEQKWLELTTATRKPETMLNEQNVLINSIPGTVSPYLTSTTAYHVAGDLKGDYMGLYEVVREEWNIADVPSLVTPEVPIFKRIASMKTFGFTTVRNMFGSTGL